MNLTALQSSAVDAVFEQWKTHTSTLGVAATGFGKTVAFSEVARRVFPKRVMVFAHRDELVTQTRNKLKAFGLKYEIEKGDSRASASHYSQAQVIVATPQTLYAGGFDRLNRFLPENIDYLICDEAHHFVGDGAFNKCIQHFRNNPALKILGLTATSQRHDQVSMARVFESVAFEIPIYQLIEEGYLVRVLAKPVRVHDIDFTKCAVKDGDFESASLAEMMGQEKVVHGLVSSVLQELPGKRGLCFNSSVDEAELMAEIFNRHIPGSAVAVSGKTASDLREYSVKQFAAGQIRYVCNCAVFTEGFDDPGIEFVLPKPTLSTASLIQQVGRGTRPICAEVYEMEDSYERCQAIAMSSKPCVTILDFHQNLKRHSLATVGDVLGGRISIEAKEKARKHVAEAEQAVDMLEELRRSEEEIKSEIAQMQLLDVAHRKGIVGHATYTAHYVDPFEEFKRARAKIDALHKWQSHPGFKLANRDRTLLVNKGHNPDAMSAQDAAKLVNDYKGIRDGQKSVLIRCGYTEAELAGLRVWDASKLIDKCKANGWKRP